MHIDDGKEYKLHEVHKLGQQKQLNKIFILSSARTQKRQKTTQKSPEIMVQLTNTTNNDKQPNLLRCLIDSGSSGCIILNEFTAGLPKQKTSDEKWMTKGGQFETKAICEVQMKLLDFSSSRTVKWKFHVDTKATSKQENYDMIIGKDLMQELGLDVKYSNLSLQWDQLEVPMREFGELRHRDSLKQNYYLKEEAVATKEMKQRAVKILDAKYEKANLRKLVQKHTHLSMFEQEQLLQLLKKFESLFDGTLGNWTGPGIEMELKEGAKPYHGKPYSVPQIHEEAMRTEVKRLVMLGVLEEVLESEWGAPSFIIPKKNGTVRFISDFRKLNTLLKRKPYPIPKIQDMLLKLQGFKYATSLDLNMGYYTIRLNPTTADMCTIVLPFGKYRYKRLPMGIAGSPDIFQGKMSSLMAGLEFVRTYLDDILIISSSHFRDHLVKLEQALLRIRKAGLKINADKSFFGKGEIEYLGYWVTRDGVQPMPAKVEAILNMEEPKTKTQLRAFIGLVNYYRDMWRRRSHVLAPLTGLTSKNVPWKWGEEEKKAFHETKKIISKEAMLAFPNFNEEFVIYTDASKFQLGGVITQNGKALAFYSRKLKDAQTRYTTTERELLSIVETLKEFRTILLGQTIKVYTDHKNLIYHDLKTERVLRWRLLLEEFGAQIEYIEGAQNIVADILSCYPTTNDPLRRVGSTKERTNGRVVCNGCFATLSYAGVIQGIGTFSTK